MERKWRNIIIALATSIGFTGILISFGLGNAIVSMINDSIGSGDLPAQVQIALNPEATGSTYFNQSDVDYLTKKIGAKNIKYLEQPFSLMMSKISFGQEGELNLVETMPNYSQIVSHPKSTDIKAESTDKKAIIAGDIYKGLDEKGITIPQTLLDDFNKANKTKLSTKEVLGKEIELTFSPQTPESKEVVTWKTTVTRVFKDDLAASSSLMSPTEMDQIITEHNFVKTISYLILELKNPDDTKNVVKKLEDPWC